MEHRYNLEDLVAARVNMMTFQNAHPDLAGFHSARYTALARAFGTHEPPARPERDHVVLDHLIEVSFRAMSKLHSPFAGFLEAPSAIVALHERSGSDISDGLAQTRSALTALIVAAIVQLHGVTEETEVTGDDLRRLGFDPSAPWPDEFDYW